MPGISVPTTIFKGRCIEQFKCRKCQLLLKDPVQTACGHRFCKSCADEMIKKENLPRCPDCKELFQDVEDGAGAQYFPDRFVRRELNNLVVICPFFEAGCDWEGKFCEYDNHARTCNFAILMCEFCNLKSVCKDQFASHQRSCFYAPQKGSAAASIKMCRCRYADVQMCRCTDVRCQLLLKDPVQTACIHYFSRSRADEKVKKDNLPGRPDEGLFGDEDGAQYGHHFSRLCAEEKVKKENLPRCPGCKELFDDEDGAQYFPDRCNPVILSEAGHDWKGKFCEYEKQVSTCNFAILSCEDYKCKKNVHKDRDFRLSLIENSNHDGSMIWKIPQFSQRKVDAGNGKYTSLPFYTGKYGFKMCLRLYIMGYGVGKGTHLSLFFVVMRGEFDNILQWPFTHKVTFKLINQAGGRHIVDTFQPAFGKPKSDMNITRGCPQFVSHTELEQGGFIVDDTIFIKCIVDRSTICHP